MVDDSVPFSDRLRQHRERLGLSRPVLGGLVGKSGEWVKAVETGRLMTPRLPMLLRLAEVLQVEDLAELMSSFEPRIVLCRDVAGRQRATTVAVVKDTTVLRVAAG